MKRLGVNIDHIATLRNARGEKHPDPINAAKRSRFVNRIFVSTDSSKLKKLAKKRGSD